jgi:hypothetical protein
MGRTLRLDFLDLDGWALPALSRLAGLVDVDEVLFARGIPPPRRALPRRRSPTLQPIHSSATKI